MASRCRRRRCGALWSCCSCRTLNCPLPGHSLATWQCAHGRWEWRKLQVLPLEEGQLAFQHARQAFRVTHRTRAQWNREETVEILYGITSLPRERAGARRLLTLHRGHWTVENRNHYPRDVTCGEDSSRLRTGWAPAANAALNNLALAVVLRRKECDSVPASLTYFSVRREEALEAILQPL